MHFTNQKRNDSKGFTLVETLVAVLMLSVIMVAITSLLTRSLQAIATSQDYFIASKIALEGMEMVRTIRNNNLIASTPSNGIVWDTNLSPNTYEFDYQTITDYDPTGVNELNAYELAVGDTARQLCMGTDSSSAGRYTYKNSLTNCVGTGTQSLQGNFTRTITISDPPNPGDPWLQVTVSVTSSSLTGRPYVLSTILFNAS